MVQRVTYKLGDGELILETGKIGKQANGCVYAQYAGTAIKQKASMPATAIHMSLKNLFIQSSLFILLRLYKNYVTFPNILSRFDVQLI